MKITSVLLILSLLIVIASARVHAADSNAADLNLAGRDYDEARENEISQKSHKRLYPGGKDEADLKVQTQLITPVRKMDPNMKISDAPVEPSSED